jgi:hypothetical protein
VLKLRKIVIMCMTSHIQETEKIDICLIIIFTLFTMLTLLFFSLGFILIQRIKSVKKLHLVNGIDTPSIRKTNNKKDTQPIPIHSGSRYPPNKAET